MRTYSKFLNSWWIKTLPGLDTEAKLILIYLRTAVNSNLIGLFYCPIPYISADLQIEQQTVRSRIETLIARGRILYDFDTKQVYIPQMAEEENGREFKEKDNRIKFIQDLYDSVAPSPLCDKFFEDYGQGYRLKQRADYRPYEPLPIPPSGPEPEQEPKPDPVPDTISKPATRKGESKPQTDKEQINALLARYTPEQQERIRESIEALATTRKTGKIAGNLIAAMLKRWDRLDVKRVLYGIEVYLDKEYFLQGKKEGYLLAIMTNASEADLRRHEKPDGVNPVVSEVTRHNQAVMDQFWKQREKDDSTGADIDV